MLLRVLTLSILRTAPNVANQIENFSECIKSSKNYVDGSHMSNESVGESSTGLKYDDNWIKYMSLGPSKVYTATSCYFLDIYYCNIDDFDSNNMGV